MNENIWVIVSQVENQNREKHFRSPNTKWEYQNPSHHNTDKIKRLIHRIAHSS